MRNGKKMLILIVVIVDLIKNMRLMDIVAHVISGIEGLVFLRIDAIVWLSEMTVGSMESQNFS